MQHPKESSEWKKKNKPTQMAVKQQVSLLSQQLNEDIPSVLTPFVFLLLLNFILCLIPYLISPRSSILYFPCPPFPTSSSSVFGKKTCSFREVGSLKDNPLGVWDLFNLLQILQTKSGYVTDIDK